MLIPIATTDRIRDIPLLTLSIVGMNGLVFLLTKDILPFVVPALAFHPADTWWHRLWALRDVQILASLFTHCFLHSSWLHLLANIWILLVFGSVVEQRIGAAKFAFLYVACAMGAALAESCLNAQPGSYLIGCSGAVAGVMGAYLIQRPTSWTLAFLYFHPLGIPIPVPTVFVVAGWLILQFHGLLLPSELTDHVAFWGHVAGLFVGMAANIVLLRLSQKVNRLDVVPAYVWDEPVGKAASQELSCSPPLEVGSHPGESRHSEGFL